MRIVCMSNPTQLPMMKNMLTSAKKHGIPMSLFHCYIENTECSGYNTDNFNKLVLRKLEIIQENMTQDKEVLWVDNDIVFFENVLSHLNSFSNYDIIIQNDLWAHCTGFMLIRTNYRTINLISKTIYLLKSTNKSTYNDQHAFNDAIKQSILILVHSLHTHEYPNGYVYFTLGERDRAKIVHCNFLKTTSEKEKRLQEYELWNIEDDILNYVKLKTD